MNKEKRMSPSRLFTGVTEIFLVLILTVFLFYTGPQGYQDIVHAKFGAFLILCGGYAAVMILLILEAALVGEYTLPNPRTLLQKSSWAQRFAVVYLVITWLSAFLSPWFPETVMGMTRREGALTITLYVLCFLLVSVFGSIRSWMLPLFGVVMVLFDGICILQIYGGNPFGLYPEGYNYFGANVDYGGAYLGTIGNVDMVAAFLCIAIPILWIALVRCEDKRKFLLCLPLVLTLFVLVKMDVFAGLVGVFGGTVLSLAVVLPVSGKTKKGLWALVGGCMVAGFAFLFLVDMGGGLFHEVHELLHGRADDAFGSGRIYIWKEVLERVPTQLLLGSGPDTMSQAGIEPFTRYDENLNATIVAQIDTAHSEYLNIWYHQGVFALLAYLALLTDLAVNWWKKSPDSRGVAILGGAALAYGIQALFGISFCGSTIYFWVVLGLLSSLINENSLEGRK